MLGGESLEGARAAVFAGLPDQQARSGARSFAFATLRAYGAAPALTDRLLHRPVTDQVLRGLLYVALTDIRANPGHDHTLVDQAVHAAQALGRHAAKGLVNAVLRNYLRHRAALESQIAALPSVRYAHPEWWVRRVRELYPECWENLLDQAAHPPPLVVRVNTLQVSVAEYRARLNEAGLESRELGPVALAIEPAVSVELLPGFEKGLCSVQDAGAQHAARLLDVHPGQRVLDACAAPGGKTTHLLELGATRVTALERDPMRAGRIEENLQRLALPARVVVGDAARPELWWDGRPFDRILADVPCTASGVVRRHPDIKWLRRSDDGHRFAREQKAILRALWSMLAPGGRLLYATCSVFPEENTERIAAFMSQHPDAQRVRLEGIDDGPIEGQLLPCSAHDGFFYAALVKPSR